MTTTFPQAFTGTVTWYLEDDSERRVQSPTFASINDARDWCEEYIESNDLDGLGEVRVVGVDHPGPRGVKKRSETKGGPKKRPVRKTKLSRPMSKTLVEALAEAQTQGETDVVVRPHDGMIARGLSNRGLITRTEAGYWRMTAEGKRMAEYLLGCLNEED